MKVLALNCGSSSLKFELVEIADDPPSTEVRLAHGAVERIGRSSAIALEAPGGGPQRFAQPVADHAEAVELAIARLRSVVRLDGPGPSCVGHRVVHGGPRFHEPTRIDRDVRAAIASAAEIAPLHNAPALAAIDAARAALPDVLHVAVFDTAFHRRMPERAARYAISVELSERHGIRRVGFHGLAHRSMCERYTALRKTYSPAHRLITLQIGHGVSVAAIDNGRCIDVSMGFSPLEGVMMGTRSGDVDPALVAHLAQVENTSADAIVHLLNERSGLLGVSGRSADMRELVAAEKAGDARAVLAVEMFVYRIRKAVGAHLAALGGADAILFGGGVGERSAEIRARICHGFGWCGLALDEDANANARGDSRISREASALEAWAISVDEERLIARDAARCLRSR